MASPLSRAMRLRRLAGLLGLALALLPAAGAQSASSRVTACAFLGDRLQDRRDSDAFRFVGKKGERVRLRLDREPDPRNRGRRARLEILDGKGRRVAVRGGALPLSLGAQLKRSGPHTARVLPEGRRRSDPAIAYTGEYCLELAGDRRAAASLVPGSDVEVQWVALGPEDDGLPPFLRRQGRGLRGDGRIQPEFPLRGGSAYGIVVTDGVRDAAGRRLRADDHFRALRDHAGRKKPKKGKKRSWKKSAKKRKKRHAKVGKKRSRRPREAGNGPVAFYRADLDDPANPFPDARLRRAGGGIRLPDRWVLRGLDPGDPALALARAELRTNADLLGRLRGFSTSAPVEIALSRPVDLATLSPANLLFFERVDGGLDLEGLLREAAGHGVPRDRVVLALSFPTLRIEDELLAARERLLEQAAAGGFAVAIEDPDPGDDLPLGVFRAGDAPPGPIAAALARPELEAVVAGLLPSPDFRGEDGSFDPARLDGTEAAPQQLLDFLLTLPAGVAPPYPVVVFQHGFAGSNGSVLDLGPVFAADGFATIGISAVEHGRRGNAFNLLTATPLQARDIFRQSNVDQMALLRALEQGIDLDGDGAAELDGRAVSYLGISLGGLLGGVLAGVEPRLGPVVLNVAGGRAARLGQAPGVRAFTEAVFADRVDLATDPPRFEAYLDRLLALGALSQNAADPLNWARRYRREPRNGGAPQRILIQQGEGDELVLNPLTEELAAVAGFATNRPQRDPAGVSGHWVFAQPGGHGIFAREDVRAQARAFLSSGGSELPAPDPTLAP